MTLGETAVDCPWAAIARSGELSGEELAGLRTQWATDRVNREVLNHWGKSINYDELAKGVIVAPAILRHIGEQLNVTFDSDRIVHAGMEHTYGYLFSVLQTSFGYKRARWVNGEIDRGFGLKAAITPYPSAGTLLANATGLATQIAWGFAPKSAHPGIRALDPEKLRGRRLEEIVHIGAREITLYTDIVEFPVKPASADANSALLVYSIFDAALGLEPRLVTLFPVQAGFAQGVFAPAKLGADQPISTRYNAFVENFADAPRSGIRREVAWPVEAP